MRIRCVKRFSGRSLRPTCRRLLLVLSRYVLLQPPLSKAPCTPGSRVPPQPFYKAIAVGNKAGVNGPQLTSLVKGGQRLRSEQAQIMQIDDNAFAGGFAAVSHIVVGDDRGEVHQRTDGEGSGQGDEVVPDQPTVGRLHRDAA